MDMSCESENSTKEGEWITPKERTKERKDKHSKKWNNQGSKPMTQQKISNLIGQEQQTTPPRNRRGGYGRNSQGTPPRPGRISHAPRPVQAKKATGVNVILSNLSSSCSGQSAPRECRQ
jgi:hypothetical protein